MQCMHLHKILLNTIKKIQKRQIRSHPSKTKKNLQVNLKKKNEKRIEEIKSKTQKKLKIKSKQCQISNVITKRK